MDAESSPSVLSAQFPTEGDAPMSRSGLIARGRGVSRKRCMSRLFETAAEALEIHVASTGVILWANGPLARLTGQTAENLAGQALSQWFHSASCGWIAEVGEVTQGPAILHILDSAGHPRSVRSVAVREPGCIVVTGVLTAECELEEQQQLHAVNNELAVASRELARQRRYQEKLARTDQLTGLANRRVLEEALPRLLDEARHADRPLSVLAIDLDHFKQINDQYGHDAGDRVLSEVAVAMRRGIRESDLAVRMGGEELMVVLPGVGADRAVYLAEALRGRIADLRPGGLPLRVTASIGVAHWAAPEEGLAGLLARADAAMYKAKANGRNRCEVATPR